MPLAINNGTALDPQPSVDPAEEIRVLNVPHRPQEGRLWCWAACVDMVLRHNETVDDMSQCQIVQTKFNDPSHVCAPNPNLRLESCEAIEIAPTWRKCGIHNVVPVNSPITMEAIKEEIKAKRPIEVGILWDEDEGGGGHAILIKGWAPTSPEGLLIDDPLRESSVGESKFGTGRSTFEDLTDALGHGRWRYTWTHLD